MKVGSLLGCVAITAGVIAACSSGGGSAGGGGGGSNEAFVTQYCDAYGPCCAKQNKVYKPDSCRLIFAAFTSASTYDPVAGQQCLDAVNLEKQNPSFCDTGLSEDGNKKCNGVFKEGAKASTGTKQPGDKCETDSECASTAEGEGNCASAFIKDATIRQCQIQTRGKEGEECVGEKQVEASSTTIITSSSGNEPPPLKAALCWIADGLFCESTFVSGTPGTPSKTVRKCTKTSNVGGPCQSSSEHACVKGAFCDTIAKQCVARKPAGETCTGSSTSLSGQCVEKHYCDSKTRVCTPFIASGAACTRNEECERRSCTNGKCGSSSGSLGTTLFVCSD